MQRHLRTTSALAATAVGVLVAMQACDRTPVAPGRVERVSGFAGPGAVLDPGVDIGALLDSLAVGGVYAVLPRGGFFGRYVSLPERAVYAGSISRHPTGIELPVGLPVRVLAEGAAVSRSTPAFQADYCAGAGYGVDPRCAVPSYTYTVHGLAPGPDVADPYSLGTGLQVRWARLGSPSTASFPVPEFFRGAVPVVGAALTAELHFDRPGSCCYYPPFGAGVDRSIPWETYEGRWRFGAVMDDGGRPEFGEPALLKMSGPRTDAPAPAPTDFTLSAVDGGALTEIRWWFLRPVANAFDGEPLPFVPASPTSTFLVPRYPDGQRSGITELAVCVGQATCRYQAPAAGAVVVQARMANGVMLGARTSGVVPPVSRVQITYASGTPLLTDGTPLILPDSLLRNGGFIGSAPAFGTGPWPDSLRLEVSVVVSHGIPLPNRVVTLEVTPVDAAGTSIDSLFGHRHRGAGAATKQAGRLSDMVVTTSATGTATVTFRPTIVSGPVVLRATSPGAEPMVDTVWVGVPGLVQLVPSVTFDTVRPTASHPSSNWVTPAMHSLLLQLADSFSATYRKKLGYNDASLRFGGKFDLRLQWDGAAPGCVFRRSGVDTVRTPWGCHQRHRLGRDVDLRTHNLSGVEKEMIAGYWEHLSGLEPKKEDDHWHLPFRR